MLLADQPSLKARDMQITGKPSEHLTTGSTLTNSCSQRGFDQVGALRVRFAVPQRTRITYQQMCVYVNDELPPEFEVG